MQGAVVTTNSEPHRSVARYERLGLIANPFAALYREGWGPGASLEIAAATNRLLAAIATAAAADKAKPIVVIKSDAVPSSYSLRAVANVEGALLHDDSLNVVHAYIQLYMMRKGRVRSTLGSVGERIAFRTFDETLARHIAAILKDPDDQLVAYQVLGPEGLAEFSARFEADPVGVTIELFGEPEIERQPELAEMVDIRLARLDHDIDESEASPEVDESVGDAPGTAAALPVADEAEQKRIAIADYVIEHTSTHLSKVIARGLRAYRDRGLGALSTEWKVTKAPRKTLAALATLATERFEKVAIIYDGFESWNQIPDDLRHTIVVTLSEMRWMLDSSAVFVLLLEEGGAPELEEQFAAGTKLRWDFPGLEHFQNAPDDLAEDIVERWIEAATITGSPMTMADPVLGALAKEADGSLSTFVKMAETAVEDAAARSVDALDEAALEAGRGALTESTSDE